MILSVSSLAVPSSMLTPGEDQTAFASVIDSLKASKAWPKRL